MSEETRDKREERREKNVGRMGMIRSFMEISEVYRRQINHGGSDEFSE